MNFRILPLAVVLSTAFALPAVSSEVILRTQQAGEGRTYPIRISADGQKILFTSDDAALSNDGNTPHLYVHDRSTGINTLVDVDSSDNPASIHDPSRAGMSDNGRFVVFTSDDPDLVTGDTNNVLDLFLRDLELGTTTRISLDASGDEVFPADVNDLILFYGADVSDDGKKVVFGASADQLFPTGENNYSGIFLRDLDLNTLTLISVGEVPTEEPNKECDFPVISVDGTKIAFLSQASNLVANDLNGVADIFFKDLAMGPLRIISKSDAGVPGNDASGVPGISADGSKIGFLSVASNLIDEETIPEVGLYIYDTTDGISLASRNESGVPVAGVQNGSFSSNGRYLTVLSNAAGVIPGDLRDRIAPADSFAPFVYLIDLDTGVLGRSYRTESGDEPAVGIFDRALSSDDGSVVYSSISPEIVTPDGNGALDIFLTPLDELVLENTAGAARRAAAVVKAELTAKYTAEAAKLKKKIKAAKKKGAKTKAKKLLKKLKALNAKIGAL